MAPRELGALDALRARGIRLSASCLRVHELGRWVSLSTEAFRPGKNSGRLDVTAASKSIALPSGGGTIEVINTSKDSWRGQLFYVDSVADVPIIVNAMRKA